MAEHPYPEGEYPRPGDIIGWRNLDGSMSMGEFPETPVYAPGHDWLQPLTVEMTFKDVDPEVLGILTGGVMGSPSAPEFSIEVHSSGRRRTFWEWLRRKPRHLPYHAYIPHARLERQTGENDAQDT